MAHSLKKRSATADSRTEMPHSAWVHLTRVASAGGLAVFAAYTLLSSSDGALFSFFNTGVYNALMILACVTAGSHAYLVKKERAAWTVITIAMSSWAFGEIWYAIFTPESYPSIADAGFIGFYLFLYVGMVLLLRSRARTIGGMLWFDGATAALAAGAAGAAVIFALVADVTAGSTSVVVTNLAYPLGDVLLLSAVFGVFALTGWRPGLRWGLLGLGVLSTTLADSIYLFQSAEGTYVEGTWIDILWPAALLLIAASAWVNDRTRAGLSLEGRPLLAVPTVCALVATGILVYDHFNRLNMLAVVLASATLGLVIVRLALTFRENGRLLALTRTEATTDSLTGLANRRQLVSDLERRLAGDPVSPTILMLFDLDGFKGYNDSFGHPAGDALLARLGSKLATVVADGGTAYRLGGDEFCLLATVAEGEAEPLIDRACEALTERGEGFDIGSSFGAVMLSGRGDGCEPRAPAGRRAPVRTEVLAAWRERADDGRLARSPLLPRARTRGATSRRRCPRARGRHDAGPASRRARRARARRPAARSRQDRGAGRDPPQAGAARRARVGVRPPAHHRRRADPARVPCTSKRRRDRPLEPRELGRKRAIPTASPARRRHSRHGSSASAAPTWRCSRASVPACALRGGRTRRARCDLPALSTTQRSCACSSLTSATSRKPSGRRSPPRAY